MVVIPFHIALDADIELARRLINETAVTSRYVYLAKPVKIVASETVIPYGLAMKLTAKAYVFDVQYEKNFQTDVVTRVCDSFLKQQITRPIFVRSENPDRIG